MPLPLLFLGAIALLTLARAIRFVPSQKRAVLVRLGRPMGVRGPGIVVVAPVIDSLVTFDTGMQELRVSDAPDVEVVVRYKTVDGEKTYRNCHSVPDALRQAARTALQKVSESRPGTPTDAFARHAVRDAMDEMMANFGIEVLEVELLPRP